jgi:hypothetical protein
VTALTTKSTQAPVTTGCHHYPCWGGPYPALRRVPSPFLPPPALLLPLTLCSTSLLPTSRLTVEHHPIQLRHRPSQMTAPLFSVEGVATTSSLSHRPRCWVGLHLRPLLPPWVGCHRPPHFDLLRNNRPHHKLPHCSSVLPNPRFHSGSHWSKPSSSTTTPPTVSPSTSRVGEGGIGSLFWSTGPKRSGGLDRFSWFGQVHYGPSLVAQCRLLFSIRIIQINSIQIQIWFELWKFVETWPSSIKLWIQLHNLISNLICGIKL